MTTKSCPALLEWLIVILDKCVKTTQRERELHSGESLQVQAFVFTLRCLYLQRR